MNSRLLAAPARSSARPSRDRDRLWRRGIREPARHRGSIREPARHRRQRQRNDWRSHRRAKPRFRLPAARRTDGTAMHKPDVRASIRASALGAPRPARHQHSKPSITETRASGAFDHGRAWRRAPPRDGCQADRGPRPGPAQPRPHPLDLQAPPAHRGQRARPRAGRRSRRSTWGDHEPQLRLSSTSWAQPRISMGCPTRVRVPSLPLLVCGRMA